MRFLHTDNTRAVARQWAMNGQKGTSRAKDVVDPAVASSQDGNASDFSLGGVITRKPARSSGCQPPAKRGAADQGCAVEQQWAACEKKRNPRPAVGEGEARDWGLHRPEARRSGFEESEVQDRRRSRFSRSDMPETLMRDGFTAHVDVHSSAVS